MIEVRARARFVRVPPNKVRQVVQHIRGLAVDDARRVLDLSPKGVAMQVRKTLDSAVANAENNHDLDADDLVVVAAIVDEGPVLRRFQPRAMGRAYRIRKRTSHITITVGMPEPAEVATGRPRAGAGEPQAARTPAAGESSEE